MQDSEDNFNNRGNSDQNGNEKSNSQGSCLPLRLTVPKATTQEATRNNVNLDDLSVFKNIRI